MAKIWAKKFYNSKVWKECRASYIDKRVAIDGGMCESCQMELGKIVHHEVWLTPENINNPMISLNHENLKYDCQTCHNQEEEGKEIEQPRYFFSKHGEIILLPPRVDDE